MLDWLTTPFETGFAGRALLELLLLAVAFGPLGVWLVTFGRAYAAESLPHTMLPGLVLATLIGAPLLLGAFAGVLVGALLIALAARAKHFGGGGPVAVAISGLFGFGVLLALVPETPVRLQGLLFGDLLSVDPANLIAAAAAVVCLTLLFLVRHRQLKLSAFDSSSAQSLGSNPNHTELLLLTALVIALTAGVLALGTLLTLALLIGPAAAAVQLNLALRGRMIAAVVVGCAAATVGIYVSYYAELAAGASVALGCVVAVASTAALRALRDRKLPRSAGPRSVGPISSLADDS